MGETKIPFQKVLETLLEERKTFPPRYLYHFSDIEVDQLNALLAVWPQVSLTRKRALLEDLEALAEADTLLSFDDLARALLTDPDAQVRILAIRLLWECEDMKLAPVFLRILNDDSDPIARATAATALGQFIYLGELEEIPSKIFHEVEDSLLAATKTADHPLVRRRALEALGFSSRTELPPLIEAAYARKDPDWQVSALFAMGRSANPERWQKQVMAMLGNENEAVRAEAVQAAGELSLQAARPVLMESLEGEADPDVRAAAIWSLSQIGGEGVRDLLENLFDETDDEEEAEFLEEALENLAFTEDMQEFDMFSFDTEDEDEL